jgi:[ribosomal protein S5]-alanine N-acetyltransferase
MEKYKSERIFLREITLEDIDDRVMSWFSDEQLMKYYTNSRQAITKEKLITSIVKGKEENNVFTFGIFENENNKLIGTLKLGPISHVHKTSDLVTLIGDREYLGKGLAVEAIKLGNQLAFEQFDIRKLYGGMYSSNIPSIKAYTRAGWIIEGRLIGYYLSDGRNEDRILVGCFNPKYFSEQDIEEIKSNEKRYL